jgi:hypothetical protein
MVLEIPSRYSVLAKSAVTKFNPCVSALCERTHEPFPVPGILCDKKICSL